VSALLFTVPIGALADAEHGETRLVLLPEARAIVDANRLPRLEVCEHQLECFRELLYHCLQGCTYRIQTLIVVQMAGR